jgi:hypothetical protein
MHTPALQAKARQQVAKAGEKATHPHQNLAILNTVSHHFSTLSPLAFSRLTACPDSAPLLLYLAPRENLWVTVD